MRILVTGLNGFTGYYVKQELETHGHQVVGLTADLSNPDAVAKDVQNLRPEGVIHLAAISFVGHGDANAFYQVNLMGTRNLLDVLAKHADNIRCVLLASSANIYGNATEGIIRESASPAPANDYAVSKLAMEYMAHLWLGQLPIVITRPFNYTGVGQSDSFLLPKIVGHFKRGERQIELGNLDVFRDFCDVRSVANACRRLVEKCPAGQTVNVCSGRGHSLREVIEMMEAVAGYRIEINVNPSFVRANEVRSLLGSAERLRNIIGEWDSPPLRETLEWMYRSQL
jgi:nucleoside-diphosphate-sugar epimerase